MGNLVEALSREIQRVTTIRAHCKEVAQLLPRANMAFVLQQCDHALERAHVAMGNGDPLEMLRVLILLQEVKE